MKATEKVHQILQERILPGDRAVDATAGNGRDTLVLAALCGATGKVWAFDIQDQAIEKTRGRLEQAHLLEQVVLVNRGHECMVEVVSPGVSAVVFNLGYLPGSDGSIVTRPETTCRALEQALGLLAPNGIVCMTMYVGHPGGAKEAQSVDRLVSSLDENHYAVEKFKGPSAPALAPIVVTIQKRASVS